MEGASAADSAICEVVIGQDVRSSSGVRTRNLFHSYYVRRTLSVLLLIGLDLLAIYVAVLAAPGVWSRFGVDVETPQWYEVRWAAVIVVVVMAILHMYSMRAERSRLVHYARADLAILFVLGVVMLVTWNTITAQSAVYIWATFVVISGVLRWLYNLSLRLVFGHTIPHRPVIVVGRPDHAARLARLFATAPPAADLRIAGVVTRRREHARERAALSSDAAAAPAAAATTTCLTPGPVGDAAEPDADHDIRSLGTLDDLEAVILRTRPMEMVVSDPDLVRDRMPQVIDLCRRHKLTLRMAAPDLEFEPGTKFRYSNSGYVVLGRIVEVVSGMEYEDFLGTELFRPAGMSDAGCDYEEGLAAGDVAVGYHYTGEDYVPVPRWDSSWAAGAGAVCASAVDLYSWSRALARGRILSDRSRDLLFGPTPQSRNAYGMGWYLRPNDCRARTYHGGYVFGFRSDFTRYPGEEADIIVLSNVDQAPTRRMAEDLAAILFGIPYDPPEFRVPASLPSSGLKNFEGVYDTSEIFGDGASMQVWTEGPRIWYRGNTVYDSLGLPMHIYPLEGGGFFDKTGDVKYEFIPGPDGAAEAVVVSDAYESYRFPRIPSR